MGGLSEARKRDVKDYAVGKFQTRAVLSGGLLDRGIQGGNNVMFFAYVTVKQAHMLTVCYDCTSRYSRTKFERDCYCMHSVIIIREHTIVEYQLLIVALVRALSESR